MSEVVSKEFKVDEALFDELDGAKPVDRQEWRHGHRSAYVIERDGKHWRVWIDVHTQDGWQLEIGDTLSAVQVEPRQVTVTQWHPVMP